MKRRRPLPHAIPSWVRADATWFVTACARSRGVDTLCVEPLATRLLESLHTHAERARWTLHLAVLMPDHLHLLLSGQDPAVVIRHWKRYTARHFGVRWQRDFFEHRLRADESFHAKVDYILQNPVRAGLVASVWAWPHKAGRALHAVRHDDGRPGGPSLPCAP
jgi:putative transposase